ncbi:ABC transporter substrate-binding protein [Bacteroidia bacterium]|nr:ABC transporter substrate-binding protein [Bacteroidia bacterium]
MKRILTNNKILKFYACFVSCFFVFTVNAQRAVGTWKEYKAYQEAFIVSETENKVFAVYDGGIIDSNDKKRYGSLLSYSPEDNSVKLYGKADGLNDVGISYMAYSKEAGALVLVYGQNSNIDILTKDGFTNIASLKDNVNYQNKTVNNLEIDGSLAYLSTAFGIVVIDLRKLEIKATYNLDKETKSVCRLGSYLYSATSDGVLRGLTNTNLSDRKNWEPYLIVSSEEDKKVEKILVFNDLIVHYRPEVGVFYKGNDEQNYRIQPGVFRQLSVNQNQLTLSGMGYVSFFSDFSSEGYTIPVNTFGVSSVKDKTIYWAAADSSGLMGIKRESSSADYSISTAGIKVNSPKRDLTYYLTYSQNKLLITGGATGSATDRSNYPGTLMVYENNSWFNFDHREIEAKTGIQCMDFVSAVVDPRNPKHYFASSYGEGLYEFLDNQFVTRYSYDTGNSSLQSANPDNVQGGKYLVRVDGLVYDKENNLYMTNSEVKNCINIYASNNEWSNIFYEPLSGQRHITQQVFIDSKNRKWVNLPRGDNSGIFVFDDKSSTPYEYFSRSFIDQQSNSIQAAGYFCIAEDLTGTIWVGTDNGPISFSNPAQVDQGRCNRVVISGDASDPYYLLYGEKINAIAVDGGNRKWFGTAGDGVFCVDINGNDDVKVTNFTAENSLLISNVINSIAINNNTGEVFIATDKGLVSYMGDAISGKTDYSDVYAYPNPVRPATDDIVVITGLMANSTVKITDLNGNLITQGLSAGGQFTWNCTKRNGQKVTSGIYLVLASTPDGKQGVATKIMVIK